MAYVLKTHIANKKNYGSARSTGVIKYIVIHYTSNDGDTDENNGKYFANNIVKASAHYFVDDDSVTQSVPDNYVAWSVGGKRYSDYKSTGGAKLYGKANNTNSISVELCDDVKNGVVYPSQATIENALVLVKELQKKYNIPTENVIRHFDVNGKKCPKYWIDDAKWEKEFRSKLTTKTEESEVIKMKMLEKGSKGNQVTIFETMMKELGYYTGAIDTDFGSGCVKACNKFQEKYPECGTNGKPDGQFGKKCWNKLFSLFKG